MKIGIMGAMGAGKDTVVPQPGAGVFIDWPDAATYGFDAAGRALVQSVPA